MYRNKKLLEVMRELPCGNCHIVDGTVVAAHRNENKGMGLKNSDALIAPLCHRCHAELDQGKLLSRDERRDMWNRAFIVGIQALIESGRLRLR